MKCVCGSEIKKDWKFCPVCGRKLKRFFDFPNFGGLFKNIEEQFLKMDKLFSTKLFSDDMFKFPDFKEMREEIPKVKGGGISVNITNVNGKPTMKVQTFGDFKKLEPGIKKGIGFKAEEERKVNVKRKAPKVTKEPESEMKRQGNLLYFKIKLPEVRSLGDIDVIKLAESIEVRAYAGDKAYFKLFKIPGEAKLVGKRFNNNVLEIQFSL